MKKLILLAVTFGVFTACETPNEPASEKSEKSEQEKHKLDEKIRLNNGEKWKVNSEMMSYIHLMEKDVSSFEGTSKAEFSELALKLDQNIELLTSNCTMTGEAHDELHKWLLPFIDSVDELSNAKNEKIASEKLRDLKDSFVAFNKYFE